MGAQNYPDNRVLVKTIMSFCVITLVFPAVMFVINPMYHHLLHLEEMAKDAEAGEGAGHSSHASSPQHGVGMIEFSLNRKDVLSAEAALKAGDAARRNTNKALAGIRGSKKVAAHLARKLSSAKREEEVAEVTPEEVVEVTPPNQVEETNGDEEPRETSEEDLHATLARMRAERDAANAERDLVLKGVSKKINSASTIQMGTTRWRKKVAAQAERRQQRRPGGYAVEPMAEPPSLPADAPPPMPECDA